jgi:hypothetical protein
MQRREALVPSEVSAMSGKNDRIILGGLIAIAVLAIAGAAAAFGYGAFVYMNGPTATPTPAPASTPAPTLAPTPTAAPSGAGAPFSMDTIKSNRADRTYEVDIGLTPGAEAIDVRRITALLQSEGISYPAWDFGHSEHRWSANADGDTLLDAGETFTLIVYAPQAGLPFGTDSPVKIALLMDAAPVCTSGELTAV